MHVVAAEYPQTTLKGIPASGSYSGNAFYETFVDGQEESGCVYLWDLVLTKCEASRTIHVLDFYKDTHWVLNTLGCVQIFVLSRQIIPKQNNWETWCEVNVNFSQLGSWNKLNFSQGISSFSILSFSQPINKVMLVLELARNWQRIAMSEFA